MPDQEDSQRGPTYVLSGDYRGAIVNIESAISGGQAVEMPARPQIFLSYSWKDDKPFVDRLASDLRERGLTVWRDVENMPSQGVPLSVEQCRAIDDCDRFVPVIGPAAFASKAVQEEWAYARKTCRAITAVWRLGEKMPGDFAAVRYFDFRAEGDYAATLNELVDKLRQSERPADLRGDFRDLPPGVIARDEFDQLDRLLREGETDAAITGQSAAVHAPGGIGKSVLANLFARDCRTRRHFTDGVIWLEVGRSPDMLVLQARLGALLGDLDGGKYYTSLQAGRDRLRDLLGHRRILVVLDDVWDPAHARPFMVPADNCRWLITTRRTGLGASLGFGRNQVIPLEYLTEDQGLALIAGVLGRDFGEGDADRPLHAAIVAALGGHTQAIAIAAAKLRPDSDYALPAGELLDRLTTDRETDRPFGELALEGEERERNLERSLEISYADLSEGDQACFRSLGVFAPDGTFGVAAAAAVMQLGRRATLDALGRLAGASLLSRAGDGRFSQHNLLRAYALARLKRVGEMEGARERHFRYYALEYGDHDRNVPYAAEGRHAAITYAFENIRHALEWGFAHAPRDACDLVLGLQNSYLQFAQPTIVRLDLLEQGRDAAVRIGYRLGEANTLQAIGDVQNFRKELDAALASYEAALGLFRAVGARLGEANTLQAIGDVQNFRKELDAALASYEAALGLFRAVGDRLGEANTLQSMGFMLLSGDNGEEGSRHLNRALAIYQEIGDRVGQANIFSRYAIMLIQNGALREAEPFLAQAAELGNQIDPRHPTIRGWNELLLRIRTDLAAADSPHTAND